MASKPDKPPKGPAPIADLMRGIFPRPETSAEERASFEQLSAQYYERFHPQLPEEQVMLDDVILCDWSIRRFQRLRLELGLSHAEWDSILASKHAAYRSAVKLLRNYQAGPISVTAPPPSPVKLVIH